MDRRAFLGHTSRATIAGAAALSAGVGTYAFGIEPHWLELVRRDLPIAALPSVLEGATLALLTDLHIGPKVSDTYLARTFVRVRALRPDLVVLAGDALTHRTSRGDAQYAQLRAVLAGFPQGRLATVAVLGNHDYGLNWQDMSVAARVTAELERAGVQVLRNATRTVAGLDVVGVEDLWSGQANPARAMADRQGAAMLALCHNPDGADVLDWGAFRGWILAGHTHGGQCRPPFLPPPLLPVRNRRYTAGPIAAPGGRTLYISRGVGHALHVRFNVRPELTLFTLRTATA